MFIDHLFLLLVGLHLILTEASAPVVAYQQFAE
jgi:hypothetical protein